VRLEGDDAERRADPLRLVRAMSMTAWWPRWTPSKLPIATLAPRSSALTYW
jgi:hypothetical protein